jgi:hypothetical protein
VGQADSIPLTIRGSPITEQLIGKSQQPTEGNYRQLVWEMELQNKSRTTKMKFEEAIHAPDMAFTLISIS